MKKIFALFSLLLSYIIAYCQYPLQQFIGTDSAIVTSKGGMQGRFVNVVFVDTLSANQQRIKQYPGAMIYASGKLWVRNTTATGWNELAYGPITPVNIYNSDGMLTGNRELDGDGYALDFTAVRKFGFSGDSLYYLLDPAGNLRLKLGNQQFTMQGDTASLSRRISYTGNFGSSFTKYSLIDKNYVDSVAALGAGTVTSVATNNGTGITGGPITTTGTLAIDTNLISTRAWRQKGIDSVAALPKVTSVGLTMPAAFAVSNSPITSSGDIAVTGAGLASQYIRGDGTLANFPGGGGGGGGASVNYYLNGGTNQGTFVGNTYYQMSKTAVIGTGADFTINANGYITQFITDAGDPALLNIPAGNWNFEMYFSASSAGGSPSFYVELYKYNGSSFTLIASSSAAPEPITSGTAIDLYLTSLAIPATTLTLTDRLAVRVYVTHSGRTITLHTQNSHLCEVLTTFTTGITAINSLTAQVQYLTTGTSGTDFNISSLTDTHTFNLPTASATNRGALSTSDWSTFNSKIGPSDTATMLSNYVTSAGYGLLKTTKTLAVDTNLISTRLWRQKGIDSVTSLINARPSGSGTTNYVSKWTSSSALGNSQIFDNGTNVGIGTATPAAKLDVSADNNEIRSTGSSVGYTQYNAFITSGVNMRIGGYANQYGFLGTTNNYPFIIQTNNVERARFFANGNFAIGTTTDVGYLLDVNGTARVKEYLYMVRQDGAATIDALRYVTGGTIDIGTTFRVLGTNQWSANTGTTAYIQNNFGSKVFASQPNQNGNFTINDFQTTSLSPTIPAGYNQKVIGSSFTISSTAINNFFGLDIRATDNSSTIANNVYGVYADATLGTNTAANRWAGYFVGRGYFSGNLGVATTSPTSSLHVVTGNVDGLRVESSNSGYLEVGKTGAGRWRMTNAYSLADVFEILYGAAGAVPTSSRLTIHTTGNTGIATAVDAGYKLDVNGTMRVQGTELRLDNSTTGTINLYSTTPVINFFSGGGYSIGRSGTAMTWNAGGSINFQISSNDAYGVSAANGHVWRTANSGGAALMRLDTGGSLSIGNSSTAAASSSILDLTSTSKGFLPPRMTTAQKNAITSPATGLVIFDTTLNKLCVYTGSAWETVTSL